jgi:hypothetical protein
MWNAKKPFGTTSTNCKSAHCSVPKSFQIVPNSSHRAFKRGFCVPRFGTTLFQIVERDRH